MSPVDHFRFVAAFVTHLKLKGIGFRPTNIRTFISLVMQPHTLYSPYIFLSPSSPTTSSCADDTFPVISSLRTHRGVPQFTIIALSSPGPLPNVVLVIGSRMHFAGLGLKTVFCNVSCFPLVIQMASTHFKNPTRTGSSATQEETTKQRSRGATRELGIERAH